MNTPTSPSLSRQGLVPAELRVLRVNGIPINQAVGVNEVTRVNVVRVEGDTVHLEVEIPTPLNWVVVPGLQRMIDP